ncbi:hypothetical protein [Pilimelia columellifera]|uniref:Uncharacterized protein n=1 Tax=Pilimelia columellifera subsp. columellifera TaxID=706583 RepID=A0ABN3NMW7_9ACTN
MHRPAAEDPQLTDDQNELLAVMRRNTKNMHNMIDKLLGMATLRAGDIAVTRQPTDLTAICRDAARSAQAASVPVNLNTPTTTPPAYDRSSTNSAAPPTTAATSGSTCNPTS